MKEIPKTRLTMLLSSAIKSINNCGDASKLLARKSNIPTFFLNIWTANKSSFKEQAYHNKQIKNKNKENERLQSHMPNK